MDSGKQLKSEKGVYSKLFAYNVVMGKKRAWNLRANEIVLKQIPNLLPPG